MTNDVLMITKIEGALLFAAAMEQELGSHVEVAAGRKEALAALRRSEYGVVMVEGNLVDTDPEWADLVWEGAGPAVPVQINFAISGPPRLSREAKSALHRRERQVCIARRQAVSALEKDLRNTVTGMLLQSQLALREPCIPEAMEARLRLLVQMAGVMVERLRTEGCEATPSPPRV